MSTVHADPYWSQVRASLKSGDLPGSYAPVDCHPQIVMTTYAVLMDNVLKKLREYAEAVKKKASSDMVAALAYQRHSPGLVKDCTDDLIKSVDGTGPNTRSVQQLTGLSLSQLQESVRKAITVAESFIKNLSPPSFPGDFNRSIQEWHNRAIVESNNHFYKTVGAVQSAAPVAWEEKDLEPFGEQRKEVEPAKMSCAQFALLKAGEKAASAYVFGKTNDTLVRELPRLLQGWGYCPVPTLNVGDLVVYYNKRREPVHVGHYIGEGLVESKIGIANPYSHRHALFAVQPVHETQVVFYRKGCKITE